MNKNGSAPASKFKNNVSMQAVTQVAMEKAEILKTWSVKTYKVFFFYYIYFYFNKSVIDLFMALARVIKIFAS